MCGIAGFVGCGGGASADHLEEIAGRMADAVAHRGPDDRGVWVDPDRQLGLGHRRLAVLDLSAHGHQPMVSADGRWVLVFNGEIYNFPTLRRTEEAHGYPFRGTSDTEVLLAAITRRGVHQTLVDAEGMFALAVLDRHEGRLTLARDRFGEKPLFYGRAGGSVLFGSELKALREHPDLDGEIDRDALTTYLRFKYVPAPRSIYRGIHKLPPATSVDIDVARGEVGAPQAYWSVDGMLARAATDPFDGSFADAVTHLGGLLRDSVAQRMVADVPVGAFLSGGVDSTAVVAVAQSLSTRPVETFTVGYEDQAWDEATRAAELARRLGTQHHELRVTPADVIDLIPQLPQMYDEPFGDSSQLPTHLVARFARRRVTVALSGDGGDEVFGGYNRHVWAPGVWEQLRRVPTPVRRAVGARAAAVGEGTWDRLGARAGKVVPGLHHRLPGQKVHKLARALQAPDASGFYRDLLSHWRDPDRLVPGGREFVPFSWPADTGFAEAAMRLDLAGYLPDDILQKVDRATMAVALEARVPYLAPAIVEFAWRLPLEHRIQGRTGKRVLRGLLAQLVPDVPEAGPKMGFGVPIGDWLRGELRTWGDDLLDGSSAVAHGLIDGEVARTAWADHQSGGNRTYELWTLLQFLSWHEAAPGV